MGAWFIESKGENSGIVGLNIGGIIIGFGILGSMFINGGGGRKGMFIGFHAGTDPGNKGGANGRNGAGGIKSLFTGGIPGNAPEAVSLFPFNWPGPQLCCG